VGEAKRLEVRPISASDANRIVKALHYSGKVVNNSQLHLGVFLDGKCGGAMQFGPSLDKRKIQPLVRGTLWNEFIELNRMAFADWLPRNGESRCLGYAMRWIRKTYPHIKWVVSFADGTQCGDGTIYRASGFVLTGVAAAKKHFRLPSGDVVHLVTLESNPTVPRPELNGRTYFDVTGGRFNPRDYLVAAKAVRASGFQLRYLYFIDQEARKRLTVPVLPFSEIDRLGAGMYKGKSRERSADSGTPGNQPGGGGANPTRSLSTPDRTKGGEGCPVT
jgi:hypothetical protein